MGDFSNFSLSIDSSSFLSRDLYSHAILDSNDVFVGDVFCRDKVKKIDAIDQKRVKFPILPLKDDIERTLKVEERKDELKPFPAHLQYTYLDSEIRYPLLFLLVFVLLS